MSFKIAQNVKNANCSTQLIHKYIIENLCKIANFATITFMKILNYGLILNFNN